jgi:hypothetical protein
MSGSSHPLTGRLSILPAPGNDLQSRVAVISRIWGSRIRGSSIRAAALLGVLAALLSTPVSGQWSVTALGDNGELYEVRIGELEALFPNAPEDSARHRVMALDVTEADGSSHRHLVPGTEGSERENRPSLVYDSGQLFILWASADSSRSSSLRLIGFQDGSFTSPMNVVDDAQELRGPPRLALTRDRYGAGASALQRTTVHLLWWQGLEGEPKVFYTPIVLVDGVYLGWNPVLELSSFDRNAKLAEPFAAIELFRAASLESGIDDTSVVVPLPQQRSGRLLTLDIQLLPSVLQNLADEIRAHIIGVGRAGLAQRGAAALEGDLRDLIVSSGVDLHAGILGFIAEQAGAALAAGSDLEVEDLAASVAQAALDAGASILGNPERAIDRACLRVQLGPEPGSSQPLLHEVRICLASDRPLPETDPYAPHVLFLSEDGAQVLAAWLSADGKLRYRKSEGDGWSATVTVSTGESLGIDQALRLLQRQIRLD